MYSKTTAFKTFVWAVCLELHVKESQDTNPRGPPVLLPGSWLILCSHENES